LTLGALVAQVGSAALRLPEPESALRGQSAHAAVALDSHLSK
jgi:hypothetical protein